MISQAERFCQQLSKQLLVPDDSAFDMERIARYLFELSLIGEEGQLRQTSISDFCMDLQVQPFLSNRLGSMSDSLMKRFVDENSLDGLIAFMIGPTGSLE